MYADLFRQGHRLSLIFCGCRAKQEVTNEARIYLAIYAALIGASVLSPALGAALLKFWVIPSVLGQVYTPVT